MRAAVVAVVAVGVAAGLAAVVRVLWDRILDSLDMQLIRRREARRLACWPIRIVLVRHGESAANIDETVYARVPDNKIPLTSRGRSQARAAGRAIHALLPARGPVSMYVSPFQRTIETSEEILEALVALDSGEPFEERQEDTRRDPALLPEDEEDGNDEVDDDYEALRRPSGRVRWDPSSSPASPWIGPPRSSTEEMVLLAAPSSQSPSSVACTGDSCPIVPPRVACIRRAISVTVDPRIREQEAGNFQDVDGAEERQRRRLLVGRFFFRYPDGESGADVYDRVTMFLDSLFRNFSRHESGRRRPPSEDRPSVIVVSHGLAIRLFLMRYFKWSVERFQAMRNLGNAEFVVLELNLDSGKYELRPSPGFPGLFDTPNDDDDLLAPNALMYGNSILDPGRN